MEDTQDKSIFGLDIDDEGKSHLSAIAQWANINAITGFVALGVSLLTLVITFNRASSYLSSAGASAAAGSGIFSFVIGLVISLALNITLLAAASNIKKGVEQVNQGLFGIGLTKLATYFKILGIITIVVLAFAGLAFLIAIVAGAGKGF